MLVFVGFAENMHPKGISVRQSHPQVRWLFYGKSTNTMMIQSH